MRLLVYAYSKCHVKASQVGTHCHVVWYGIREISKLHELVEFIVCCQHRFFHYICHVGISQNINLSFHGKVVKWSVYCAEEVNECFSVNLRPRIAFSIDNLKVGCFHSHIKTHLVHIGEVQTSLYVQWTIVVGKHLEVLKQHFAVDNPYRVVGKPHLNSIRIAEQIA